MDETLQELENELKRLAPRRPSASLLRGLEHALGPVVTVAPPARRPRAPTSLSSWLWTPWSLAGVALAALALFAGLQLARRSVEPSFQPRAMELAQTAATKPARAASNRYQPVAASSVLYDLKEDGTTHLADRTEARQLRYRFVDTYTWKNPATKASLRWSVPRDEVRVVRARLD